MNANELRIGNWVRFISTDSFEIVENIKHNYTNNVSNIDCEPIPLTPEILLKCGFKKNDDAGNWNSPEHTIYSIKGMSVGIIDNYIGWYNQSEDDFYSSFYPQLKSLHQLQNLYYALTQTELPITLTNK